MYMARGFSLTYEIFHVNLLSSILTKVGKIEWTKWADCLYKKINLTKWSILIAKKKEAKNDADREGWIMMDFDKSDKIPVFTYAFLLRRVDIPECW